MDRSDQKEVNSFNKIMSVYNELRDPSIITERTDAVADRAEELAALEHLDLSKLDIEPMKKENIPTETTEDTIRII